jgi:hypothetical protein
MGNPHRPTILQLARYSLLCAILCSGFLSPNLQAHPLEYHMQPLDADTMERVIHSFDQMAVELRKAGYLHAVRLTDEAVGISALFWSIQDAMAAADETAIADSPTLNRALLSAGYQDSPYLVEEWQTEAQQVLETYEVLKRGLSLRQVYEGYAAFESERAALTNEQALERESALVNDHQLVRTTTKDRHLVEQYLPRLDVMIGQFGISFE